MYKIFYACLTIFWILDVIDMPFMAMFDTTYPINTLAWFLIFCFVPSISYIQDNHKEDK